MILVSDSAVFRSRVFCSLCKRKIHDTHIHKHTQRIRWDRIHPFYKKKRNRKRTHILTQTETYASAFADMYINMFFVCVLLLKHIVPPPPPFFAREARTPFGEFFSLHRLKTMPRALVERGRGTAGGGAPHWSVLAVWLHKHHNILSLFLVTCMCQQRAASSTQSRKCLCIIYIHTKKNK